jgi:hypothetical protein
MYSVLPFIYVAVILKGVVKLRKFVSLQCMVDSKELRIGNWLQYPFIGKSQIRDGSDIDNVYSDAGDAIPLTSEILEACGFDKEGYFFPTGVNEQYLQFRNNTLSLCGSEACISGDCFDVKIEFLHQFQNLYFFLTGKELTINLHAEVVK